MTLPNRRAQANGPFQDALVHEYSRRISAASDVIIHALAAKHDVTIAEVAHAIASAASSEKDGAE